MSVDAPEIRTDRLLLRGWREEDRAPFAALNADPEVTRYFAGALTRDESDVLVDRIEQGFAEHGFGLWALQVADTGAFIGFTGLSVPGFAAPFMPAVEVGWRLARSAWGHGYATEAARATLGHGFAEAGLDEIVSFTTTTNAPSRKVMERIGMTRDPADDFDHPRLAADHALVRHVLYRIRADSWRATTADRQ